MKWQDLRQSQNVEDRRGFGPRMGGMSFRGGGLGIGGLIVVVLLGWMFGVDPMSFLSSGGLDPGPGTSAPAGTTTPPTDEGGRFATAILGDTEDVWTREFSRAGASYTPARLVLFNDQVDSACGLASTAVGPFYCPGDRKVYLDLSFYRDLDQRFGAPGDFAQAYVIAHEVGHHVQNLLGALGDGSGLSRGQANAKSVQQELQADCLAGVWGHSAASRRVLEPGDLDEGLTAAAAVGDDRIQRATRGQVVPESFTHGSSAARVAAFRRGLETGEITACGLAVR